MNNISISFKILDATSEWLVQEKQDLLSTHINPGTAAPIRKPLTLKLCPIIIETLKKIYSADNLQEN